MFVFPSFQCLLVSYFIYTTRYEYYRSRETQEEKTKVAWSIVEEVEQRGGRFLVECKEGFWVQLQDRNAIREKISNAIRDIRKTSFGENVIQKTNSRCVGSEIFGLFKPLLEKKQIFDTHKHRQMWILIFSSANLDICLFFSLFHPLCAFFLNQP